jgi:hypothetical protein
MNIQYDPKDDSSNRVTLDNGQDMHQIVHTEMSDKIGWSFITVELKNEKDTLKSIFFNGDKKNEEKLDYLAFIYELELFFCNDNTLSNTLCNM